MLLNFVILCFLLLCFVTAAARLDDYSSDLNWKLPAISSDKDAIRGNIHFICMEIKTLKCIILVLILQAAVFLLVTEKANEGCIRYFVDGTAYCWTKLSRLLVTHLLMLAYCT